MRWLWLVPVLLLGGGASLVAWGVVEGGANVALVVIIPVIWGASAPFLAGVALLFVGFLTLPFAFVEVEEEGEGERLASALPAGDRGQESQARESGVGGFVLIGPVPIVFGSWRGISRTTRWVLALVGAVVFTTVVVALLWLLR